MLKLIQRGGQRTFLAVERVFNHAFGEENNPFYHLGAIAYFLLWLVVASGIYVYVFFDTGVSQAYESVERLTHGQWYAGGILRSVHRYASDGLVLAMLLHVVRHFTFDRYRGFRWFSWISGLVVLWMVYVSGVNGFMLPWDRLAQFVTVGSAEWLDWLPIFNGTLSRNFIYTGSVNDRLFSLLSFLHIGFPLGVLALLWVHTQRVAGAKMQPPRPLMAWLTAAMVVLSLVKPVVSQGAADLATVPARIDLDWFYLPVFPLFDRWAMGSVWLLVAGATVLVALLPWLPPRRARGVTAQQLLIHPDNRIVASRPGETLLESALRDGIAFPYECRNGGCGECKCTIIEGRVDLGSYQDDVLSESERARGIALACCATALTDVVLEYVPKLAPGGIAAATFRARVDAMDLLVDDVMRIRLAPLDGHHVEFRAGQYVNVILPEGERRSYSFATAPHAGGPIELQVRLMPGGLFTPHVFSGMKRGDVLDLEGPLGSFFLREDSDKPMIFVAGATGIAPVKSMLEHAFHVGVRRPMILYWGARTRKDLYLLDLAREWEAKHANFRFIPVLSDARPDDHWTGRTGLVHEAILADYPDLSTHQLYACGSTEMVAVAHPAFIARGLAADDCFSDVFRLAPHRRHSAATAEFVRLGGQPS